MVQTKQSKKKESVLCFLSLSSLFLGIERAFPAHREASTYLLKLAVLMSRWKVLGAKEEEDRDSICEAWQRNGIFLFEFLA